MKKYIIIAVALLGVAAIATIGIQGARIDRLTEERNRHQHNSESLLQDVERYRVQDSLNAAKVGILELKLADFEKYRAKDATLIKELKRRNEDLQNFSKVQMETIYNLEARLKDTIVVTGNDTVRLQRVEYNDAWLQVSGLIDRDRFSGTIISRDSLILYNIVEYKRFLCFLWRTKRIKKQEFVILSKNPHTEIRDVEVINIVR